MKALCLPSKKNYTNDCFETGAVEMIVGDGSTNIQDCPRSVGVEGNWF
jgi:hypothetical protein